jgi:hypothetical protein
MTCREPQQDTPLQTQNPALEVVRRAAVLVIPVMELNGKEQKSAFKLLNILVLGYPIGLYSQN